MRSDRRAALLGILVIGATVACSNSSVSQGKAANQAGAGTANNVAGASARSSSQMPSGGSSAALPNAGGTLAVSAAGVGNVTASAGVGNVGTTARTGCTQDSDCAALLTRPENCAAATCANGICTYLTVDADGDGVRTKRCQSLDPEIGVNVGRDCDDADPKVSPLGWDGPASGSLASGCNDGLDNDCSGTIDDGITDTGATCICSPGETTPCSQTSSGLAIVYPALDTAGKPLGVCKFGSKTCEPNGTWAECSGAIPPQLETCDGSDNDCDGIPSKIDSDTPKPNWVCDADSDGHLAKNALGRVSCDAPTSGCTGNWLLENSAPVDDCDDTSASMFPGGTEICDGKDNNCNGLVDDAAVDMKVWSYDADSDLYRRAEFEPVQSCAAPTAAPANCASLQTSCPATAWKGATNPLPPGDCNDNAANRNPGALKDLCDGSDYNCDGSALTGCSCQAGSTQACGAHAGYDGKGTCKAGTQTCIGGAWGDCVGSIGPVAEKCGTLDLDCDGVVGNSDSNATDKASFACDRDGDGFLAPNATTVASCLTPTTTCSGAWRKNPAPADFNDCSDTDNAIYPGAAERCNLLDDNCDKSSGKTSPAAEPGEDADGDGYASTTAACTAGTLPRSDCWDSDKRVHPNQTTRYADGFCTNSAYPYWCGQSAYRGCYAIANCGALPSAKVNASYDFNCDGAETRYDASALGMTTGTYEAKCLTMVPTESACASSLVPYVTAGACGQAGTYRSCVTDGGGPRTIGTSTVWICEMTNDTSRYVECS